MKMTIDPFWHLVQNYSIRYMYIYYSTHSVFGGFEENLAFLLATSILAYPYFQKYKKYAVVADNDAVAGDDTDDDDDDHNNSNRYSDSNNNNNNNNSIFFIFLKIWIS